MTGSRVNLIVHNEVQDISCNKMVVVMLLCEGENLNLLRWSYPPLIPDTIFLSDSIPQNTPKPVSSIINPPLLTVQLLDVTQSIDSFIRADFSSILTFDLLELRNQNVTKIACGDIVVTQEKSVINLMDTIVEPQPTVTATYQRGMLTNIRVQFNNLVRI